MLLLVVACELQGAICFGHNGIVYVLRIFAVHSTIEPLPQNPRSALVNVLDLVQTLARAIKYHKYTDYGQLWLCISHTLLIRFMFVFVLHTMSINNNMIHKRRDHTAVRGAIKGTKWPYGFAVFARSSIPPFCPCLFIGR